MDEEEVIDFAQLPCLRCRQITNYVGRMPIRTGGATGIRHWLGGEWTEMKEEIFELDVYRCPVCGHVEFFDFDMNLAEIPPQE